MSVERNTARSQSHAQNAPSIDKKNTAEDSITGQKRNDRSQVRDSSPKRQNNFREHNTSRNEPPGRGTRDARFGTNDRERGGFIPEGVNGRFAAQDRGKGGGGWGGGMDINHYGPIGGERGDRGGKGKGVGKGKGIPPMQLAPTPVINRDNVCPTLVRVFWSLNGYHHDINAYNRKTNPLGSVLKNTTPSSTSTSTNTEVSSSMKMNEKSVDENDKIKHAEKQEVKHNTEKSDNIQDDQSEQKNRGKKASETDAGDSSSSMAAKDKKDKEDEEEDHQELYLHTWPDATLRELFELLKGGHGIDSSSSSSSSSSKQDDISNTSLCHALKQRGVRVSFALVYPDRLGKYKLLEVGCVSETNGSMDESSRSLAAVKFQAGDFLDVSVSLPSYGNRQRPY